MKFTFWLYAACLVLFNNNVSATEQEVSANEFTFTESVFSDYSEFYSTDTWLDLSYALAGGAVLANTELDQNFTNMYQNDIRTRATDDLASIVKIFGEKSIMVPFTLAMVTMPLYTNVKSDNVFIRWSSYSLRNYVVGLPIMLLGQKVTGASRPTEQTYGSDWKTFKDKNGVSGHAFGGAVPFLSAAYMFDEGSWQRNSFIFASTLTAWSRVNDNDHYLSQALLGWYLAYKTTQAVFKTNENQNTKNQLNFTPIVNAQHVGIQVSMLF